jgi:hypothetical protein
VFRGSTAPYSSLFIILSGQTTPRRDFVEVLADETGSGREGPTRVESTSWKGRAALKFAPSVHGLGFDRAPGADCDR